MPSRKFSKAAPEQLDLGWHPPGLVAGVDECLEGARRIVEFCQQR